MNYRGKLLFPILNSQFSILNLHITLPSPVFFLFSLSFCLSAADYTLSDCLNKALESNPEIEQAKKHLEASGYQAKQAKTFFYPTTDMTASTGTVSESSSIRFESMPYSSPLTESSGPLVMQIGEKERSELSVRLSQKVYTGGMLQNKAKAASEKEQAAIYELELRRDQIRHEVIRAFYQLMKAMEMKKVALAGREQINRHLQDATNLLNQGMLMKNELLTIDMKKCDIDLMIIQSEHLIAKTKALLAERMGLSPQDELTIESSLSDKPPWPIPSVFLEKNRLRMEQLITKQMISASNAELNALKGSELPQVGLTLSAHHGWPGFISNDPQWSSWWQAQLQVSWNVFDMGRKRLAISEMSAEKEKLESSMQSLGNKIALDRLNTRLNYEECRKNTEIASKKVASAQENFRIVEDQFHSGTATNATFLDAQTDLTKAGMEQAVAMADLRIAWADFLMSLGEIKHFLKKIE
ncbi:MAG: TolC family protein [Candidatus Aureabacteria bacterium]|nr:TolC family protein [Candidatus Auribacterota bacterium]